MREKNDYKQSQLRIANTVKLGISLNHLKLTYLYYKNNDPFQAVYKKIKIWNHQIQPINC